MKAARLNCLGVLGGMGPLAGAQFAVRLAQLTPAARDQEHIPVVLRNDPRIPDRSSAMLGGGECPLTEMMRGIAMLEDAGADCIAIPCNTAHLWFEQLQAASRTQLLHIAEAVVLDLRRHGLARGKVGVLGTRATLEMGLYQRFLRDAGYEALVPQEEPVLKDCSDAIAAVKGNRLDQAFAPAARSIEWLVRHGARAVVLGCTELPLAIPQERRHAFGTLITDSIDALARQAVDLFRASEVPERRYA
jgi:aspartate racemase